MNFHFLKVKAIFINNRKIDSKDNERDLRIIKSIAATVMSFILLNGF